MRKGFLGAAVACIGVLVAATPSWAHHSFAAEYDSSQEISLTGKITKVEWTNPHIYIHIDVVEGGKVTSWALEGYPPNTLKRTGFSRNLLKEGDTITITGYRARENPTRAAGREMTVAAGAKYNFGPLPSPSNMGWSFVAPTR